MNNLSQCILVILLFISNQFAYNAQTLDATFSSPTTTQCAGSLFTLNATTNGYQSYNWTISGPNAYSSNLTDSSTSLNLTEAGTYNVSLTVSDGITSETNTVNGYLTVNPAPSFSAQSTIVCSGNSFSFTPNNTTVGTTFSWPAPTTIGITGLASGTNQTSINGTLVNATNAGLNVVYTVTPSSGSCVGSSFTLTVTVNPVPAISNMTAIVCSGNAFTVIPENFTNGVVTVATVYTWTAPSVVGISGTTSGTNQVSINGTLVNTNSIPLNVVYTVTPSSGPCSGSTFNVTVTVNPRPTITAKTATICSNNSFLVSPTNGTGGDIVLTGTTYTWTVNNNANVVGESNQTTPQTNISQTLTSSSSSTQVVNYIVTPSSGSCSGPTFNVTVTVNPLPTITLSSNSVCVNSTVQLTPSTGGTWVSNNSSIATVSGTSGLVTGVSPGIVSFAFTNTFTGCSNSSSSLTVNSNATVTISVTESSVTANDGIICRGANVTLTGNPSVSGGTYVWSNGAISPSITVTPNSTTVYSLTYTLVCASAPVSSTITVNLNPVPAYSATVSNNCSAPVTTTYTSTATAGQGTITNINWSFPSGSPTSSTSTSQSVTYNTSGTYPISQTVINSLGCVTATTFPNAMVVGNGNTPTSSFVNLTPLTQCIGIDTVRFQYTGTGADTIRVDWGDGLLQYFPETANFNHKYTVCGTFTVTLTPYQVINGALACAGIPTTYTVEIKGPQAIIDVSAIDCSNQANRTFTSASSSTGTMTLQWQIINTSPVYNVTSTATTFPQTFPSASATPYKVRLTATDASTGCAASIDSVNVYALPNNLADFKASTGTSTSSTEVTEICVDDCLNFINTTPLPQYNPSNSGTSTFTRWDFKTDDGLQWPSAPNVSIRGTPKSNCFSTTLNAAAISYTPGIYGVAMLNIDINGCRDTIVKSNYIRVHGINGTFSVVDTICVNTNVAVIDNSVAPLGSIVSREWYWGDGTTNTIGNISNPSHIYTNTGIYTISLTATDDFGCTKTTTKQIVVLSSTVVDPISNQVVCAGTLTTPITFTGSGQQYNWTNDNPFIGLTTSGTGNIAAFTAINNALNIQIATITVTPISSGCNSTPITFTITVKPISTVNDPQDQVLCANNSTQTINFSGAALTTNYNWTNDNQSIGLTSSGSGDIPSFLGQNNSTTNQTANLSVTPILDGCVGTTQTFTIIVKPIPILNPVLDETVCQNSSTQTIVFSSSNPGTVYNWTQDSPSIGCAGSGSTNFIPSFVAQNTTTAPQIATFIVAPSLNGCLGTAISFTITVMPLPTVIASPDQTVCHYDITIPVNFSGAINTSVYNWNGSSNIGMLSMSGTGNIPAFSAFNGSQTTIIDSIIVTPSLNSCVGVSDTFLIIVKPISTVFSVSDQTVCAGESTSPIAFSGSNLNTVYYWTLDNTSIGIVSSGTGNIPAFQVQNTTSNIQTTNIIVTPNLNGCIWVSDTFSITVNPLPIINAGNDITLCYGATFTPIATGTAITISWNNGVVQGTSFTPTVTETYIATGTNMNCYNSDSVTITVNPLPLLTISTFDGEDSLACDGTLSVLVTDGNAPYSYTWTNGASNYTTSAIQDLCSGTYSLSVVDANGCSATNSATINDTLIQNVIGDTLIFTDNIYQDSTIIGSDTSAWIENCTFDYSLVTGATIDSYIDNGDSTVVTWIIALSTGSTVSVDATYYLSPGTTGVYDLTLQLYCSAKSGPKFLVASSRLYYEASTIGLETHSLNAIYLYPNPTKSTLSISGINTNFSYKISDLQGKLLKQGANDKQIEIENLPAGSYVIGISTDNEVKQLRFVKL